MKHVPNILSILRILAAPVIIAVYFFSGTNARLTVAIIYIAASATDMLDGLIARRFNAISNLGRILDPLGDKLLMLAVMGCLAADRRLPVWAFVLLFLKEGFMILGSAFVHGKFKYEMPPSVFAGKAATFVLFIIGMSFLIFDIPRPITDYMAAVAVGVAFLAFGGYLTVYRNLSKKHQQEIQQENQQ